MSSPQKPISTQERLEARINRETKVLLKRASYLTGRSLTDFVVNAARDAAVRIIKEHDIIQLSVEDGNTIIEALNNPPSPTKTLIEAVAQYKKDVASDKP